MLSAVSRFPESKRLLKDGKTPSTTFADNKATLLETLPRYFDASVAHAHLLAKDNPGSDSDLKWLQVIRGEREGVAKMAGLDQKHLQHIAFLRPDSRTGM